MEHFNYILILLSCSVVFVVLCRRLHLPPIIGYLLVGMLVGPGGIGWIPSIEKMHFLAEFGIVFLMFTLGLEFSIPQLIAAKRTLFGVGGLQVFLCGLALGALGMYINLPVKEAFLIGFALALSSTAVVVKQLSEQKDLHSDHGSMSVNILLLQDIAAVLLLISIPALAGTQTLLPAFLVTFAKGLGAFIGMVLIGMWLLRPLFHEVAKARSTELFMIATLLVVLSAAAITHFMQLSMALGAFLAGLMLGETEFKHQIEIDIRPFRNVLLGLFFIIVGSFLEIKELPHILPNVLILLCAIILIKATLIFGITKIFTKFSLESALRTGIILAHGGEFGFVVLTEAIANDIIPATHKPTIFAAVVISIMIAPFLINFNKHITRLLVKPSKSQPTIDYPSASLSQYALQQQNHVIICGFGRVGQTLAKFLDEEKINWLALDIEPTLLNQLSMAGEYVFYGNASNPEILSAAGLSKARMVVITFKDHITSLDTVQQVRNLRLDLPLFVRAADDNSAEKLQAAGATEVVPELLEGSLMLASHLLLSLGVPANKVINKVRDIHSDRYESLRNIYKGKEEHNTLEETDSARRCLHSINIPEGAFAIDKTIATFFSSEKQYRLTCLTRKGERITKPKGDTLITAKDTLIVHATAEEKTLLEQHLLTNFAKEL